MPSIVPVKVPILKDLRHLTIQARLPGGQHFPLDVELLRAAPALCQLTMSGISFFRLHRSSQESWRWPSLQAVSFRACSQEEIVLDRISSQQQDVELDDLPGLRRIRRFLLRDKLVFDLEVFAVHAPTSPRTPCFADARLVRRASYRSIRQGYVDLMLLALARPPLDGVRLQNCFEQADYPRQVSVSRKTTARKVAC